MKSAYKAKQTSLFLSTSQRSGCLSRARKKKNATRHLRAARADALVHPLPASAEASAVCPRPHRSGPSCVHCLHSSLLCSIFKILKGQMICVTQHTWVNWRENQMVLSMEQTLQASQAGKQKNDVVPNATQVEFVLAMPYPWRQTLQTGILLQTSNFSQAICHQLLYPSLATPCCSSLKSSVSER